MKKLILLFSALTLSVGLWAINNVKYIDADGKEQTVNKVTEIKNYSSTLKAGWYVVRGTDVQTGTLTCSGAVHLIIADGAKLTAMGVDAQAGIHVSGNGNSLTIYGQTNQSGQLFASCGPYGKSAGIGSENNNGSGSNITINGGIVTANGGYYGAGIGGGWRCDGSNITINRGTVVANGGSEGAGIGGGDGGSGYNITINGGTVTANGGGGELSSGAGIGGGNDGSGYNITINGGTVTANGGNSVIGHASGIGGGKKGNGSNIKVTCPFTTYAVLAGNSNPPTEEVAIPRTATTDIAGNLAGKKYAIIKHRTEPTIVPVSYIDENGVEQTTKANTIISSDTTVTWGEAETTTWHYIINGTEANLAKGAVCNGDVRLIIGDGAKLTATGVGDQAGIQVSGNGDSLKIYGQTEQSGQLVANGGSQSAGIGGGQKQNGSNITINGGIVTANGGEHGTGIGGGYYGSGSNITINGGIVTANGGEHGAGIGGGDYASGSNITINGGIVTANGGNAAAGIGSGNCGSGSGLTINRGTVKATGGYHGAGIGGGATGSYSNIIIKDGTITATGGDGGAGIGGGYGGNGSNITIHSGIITANGGISASGIGGAGGGYGSNIKVLRPFTEYAVLAGNSNPPTEEVATSRTDETDIASDLADKRYATLKHRTEPTIVPVSYIDENGKEQTTKAYTVLSSDTTVTWGEAETTTWYFVIYNTEANLAEGAICNGDVRLILGDGAKLTTTGAQLSAGIQVSGEGNSLTIYGQAVQSGQLIANGGEYGPGIGGRTITEGSNITINGGNITATGGDACAGIGGGNGGDGFNITINRGTVVATGGTNAAGIGGGNGKDGYNITINGGKVTAKNGISKYGVGAAGIGGGEGGSGYDITINGGMVTAIATEGASCIGAGYEGSASYNIKVAKDLIVKADNNNPPTTIIAPTHTAETDIASDLKDRLYAEVIMVPKSIAVKTPPAKVDYIEGDFFDPTGLVITATYSDNTTEDIAYSGHERHFSFSPALDVALQNADTQVTISYLGISCTQAITVISTTVVSIAVKTPPTKVDYIEGNFFNPTGLVITATYGDGSTEDFSYEGYADYISLNPALDVPLQTTDTQVIISHEDLSCTQAITVVATKLLSIVIKTAPTKLEYNVGEHFDPTGLVITAAYDNGKSVDIAYSGPESELSFNPALDAALQISDTEVTITYGGKSCTQPIVMFDKAAALAEIAAAMEGNEDSEYLNGLVATQVTAIKNAVTAAVVNTNRDEAIAIIKAAIPTFKAIKAEGDAAGYKRAKGDLLGDMATHCTGCTAVDVKKGEKVVTLYAPENVKYKKIED